MTGSQAGFLQALGWAILNSLWQLALLWVIYQFVTGLFRKTRPAEKSLLASALLIAGFGWFLYTFIGAYSASSSGLQLVNSGNGDPGSFNLILQKLLPYASAIYLLLLLIPLSRFIRNYRYVQVIRRYGLSRIDPQWRIFVSKVSQLMGIRKKVQIWVSEWVTSPVTIGFFKPIILVPLAAINHLSPSQIESVILHELGHIKRFDYLVNLILNIIRVILYFNPFAKAFLRIVEKEREKSCDETVLQFQYASHDYATALLLLEKVKQQNKILILSASGQQQDLVHRVECIMGLRQKPVSRVRLVAGIIACLLGVLCMNFWLFPGKKQSSEDISPIVTRITDPVMNGNGLLSASLVEKTGTEIRNKILKAAYPKKQATPKSPETEVPVPASLHSLRLRSGQAALISANFEFVPEVILNKKEEEQVKEAIEASRKVLENEQWNMLERKVADVYNLEQKEELRNTLKKELNKVDWQQWEQRLRQAYDRVDWEKVNEQLNKAVSQVQLDSMLHVYNKTVVTLSRVQKELSNQCLDGIPDTDITIREIADKQKQVQKAMNVLRSMKTKKIVHL